MDLALTHRYNLRSRPAELITQSSVSEAMFSNLNSTFPFLKLPLEIRLKIYSYLLATPPGESFHLDKPLCNWSFSGVSSDVLLTSKQVFNEAFPVFLQDNDFLMGESFQVPIIFLRIGPKACSSIRFLSIHLNTRDKIDVDCLLDGVNRYCTDIRHLELRTHAHSEFLPRLARLLKTRARLSDEACSTITLEVSILKHNPSPKNQELTMETITAIEDAFSIDHVRYSMGGQHDLRNILKMASNITVRGCLNQEGLQIFEKLRFDGWCFEKTSTVEMTEDNEYRRQYVVRKWRKAIVD